MGRAHALNHVNLDLNRGEKLCLVGESGSGKSTMGLAMMRMIKPPGRIEGGEVIIEDQNLLIRFLLNAVVCPIKPFIIFV